MILDPTRYEQDQFDMGNVAHLLKWDIVMETEADDEYGTRVMDIVLDNCGPTLQETQAELEEAHRLGENWADATKATIVICMTCLIPLPSFDRSLIITTYRLCNK